jgi:hypothetical protein
MVISIAAYGAAYSQQKISMDFQKCPSALTLFCPEQVSTFLNERDFAISPEGNEIYYTISTPKSGFQTIVSIRKVGKGCFVAPGSLGPAY